MTQQKAYLYVQVQCPGCWFVMTRIAPDKTIHCRNPVCKQYMIRYEAPTILLNPVPEKIP